MEKSKKRLIIFFLFEDNKMTLKKTIKNLKINQNFFIQVINHNKQC